MMKKLDGMASDIKDIKTKWALQLFREFEQIAGKYGVNLTTPIFDISSGKKRLAYWNPKLKMISVSSYLITTEPWEIVIEILKHEMAHQYVTEYCEGADVHGKYFKLACKKLGVHPAFVSANNYAQKLLAFKGDLPAEAKKMLQKVEKLLALGQSSNEAEAQAASMKANYLLNKYNLQRFDNGNDHPDIKYLTICHKKKRIESIQRAIVGILQNYYSVNGITSETYNAFDDATYKCLVLIGRKESLLVAEYVYHFLLDTALSLWEKFKKERHAKKSEKVSFDMGFVSGIKYNHEAMFSASEIKLNGDSSLPVASAKALMAQSFIENRQEKSRLFPLLKNVKFGHHFASSGAFKEGYEKGKNTYINKSLERKKDGVTGLLSI